VATSLAFLKDYTPTAGIGAENLWEFPHFKISSRHTLTAAFTGMTHNEAGG